MLSDKEIMEQADMLLLTDSSHPSNNGWYKRQDDGSLLKLAVDGLTLERENSLGDEVKRLFIILEGYSADEQIRLIKAVSILLDIEESIKS